MKSKCFHLILLLQICFLARSQNHFVVISDKDGFVNVRDSGNINARIICQLDNGMVVSASWEPDSVNWIFVEFYLPKEQGEKVKSKPIAAESEPEVKLMKGYFLFSGYIYKDRLKDIEKQKELNKKWSGDNFLLYNDSVKIKFTPADFQKNKHKITKDKKYNEYKIDGHYIAGTDGGIPREEISKFSVSINNKTIVIPHSAYLDLYEPNLNRFTRAYISLGGTLYIIMGNSDGAGWYDVIFIFKDEKYIGRYVFNGGC